MKINADGIRMSLLIIYSLATGFGIAWAISVEPPHWIIAIALAVQIVVIFPQVLF